MASEPVETFKENLKETIERYGSMFSVYTIRYKGYCRWRLGGLEWCPIHPNRVRAVCDCPGIPGDGLGPVPKHP